MASNPGYANLEKRLQELESKLLERKAAYTRVKKNAELYRTMFDNAGVAMIVTDLRTGRVIDFNKKAHTETGHSANEYRNRNLENNIIAEYQNNIKSLLETGNYAGQSKIVRKDGTTAAVMRRGVLVNVGEKKYVLNIRMDLSDYELTMERLEESKKRYRSILENIHEGYYEVDLAGNFTFFNPALAKIFGSPAEEMMGRNNRDYMTPETARKAYDFTNELYRTGKSPARHLDCEVIQKDGSIVYTEISVSLIKNSDGEVTGFRGLVRDVTERNKAERGIRESEVLYRTMFEHAGFTIDLLDPYTGKHVAYNRQTYEGLGYTEVEYKRLTPPEFLVTPVDVMANHIRETLKQGIHTCDTQLKRKDGNIRDLFVSSIIVKINGKKYIHNIGVDVTDQKRSAKALKESEARFRNIFEGAGDAIFLCDMDLEKILDANHAACTYLGYDYGHLMKIPYRALMENPIEETKIIKNLLNTGISFNEAIHRRKDGALVHVEISSCLMELGKQKAILNIVRDVTERKLTEENLKNYRKNLESMIAKRTLELEATEKELVQKEKLAMLGQLTATVSHELRNPLGVIQSSGYYLQKKLGEKDKGAGKDLKHIDDQVMVCDAIIGDLLEYTRGSYVELLNDDILSWLVPLLEQMDQAEGITIQREIPNNLPKIDHDPSKMKRVVKNVLKNALQAVAEKAEAYKKHERPYWPAIRFGVGLEKTGIVIEISDNGIGMTREVQAQVFTPLFTTRKRGTGLGMANVLKIMEDHGGRISMTSLPDEGTTIRLFLPFNHCEKTV